jgi:2'-5' RNA ligase
LTAPQSSLHRLFVGLQPPAEIARRLHAQAVSALDARDWRLYGASDIHLTLCFLGDVLAEQVEPFVEHLARALEGAHAPRVAIAGTGAFPSDRSPRVLWAGVRGEPAELDLLDRLARAVVRAVKTVGLQCDEPATFKPHLTLARPRGRVAWPESFAALSFDEPWQPDAVQLFESLAGTDAPKRYPSLRTFPLDVRAR